MKMKMNAARRGDLTAHRQVIAASCAERARAAEPEHLAGALLGVEPQEIEVGPLPSEPVAPAADLAEKPALAGQMIGRPIEDAAHDVETVLAAGQRHRRLMAIFGRQRGHGVSAHIRRVGEDQVVAPAGDRSVEVAGMEGDAVPVGTGVDVDAGDLQGRGRQLDGVDRGAREQAGGHNGKAARTGTEVEHAGYSPGVDETGENIGEQQLAEVGPGTITRSSTKNGMPWT